MILTCPACATSYFTPEEAIGPMGRKVRCQACGEVWKAVSEEPLELSRSGEPGFTPRPDPAPPPVAGGESSENLAETPAPELPRAFRARAEQQRRLRRAATHGAAWAGLAGVFVAILGTAWIFRVDVVDLYPRAASVYAAVGARVNPTGLEFEAVGARAMTDDPSLVLVSGALRNVRDREIVAPPVRVALLDAHGVELGHRIVAIDAAPVLPGRVQGFAVRIPDPGGKATGVGVDFVLVPSQAAADRQPSAEAPPRAPAATPRVLPAAAVGLRPAMSDAGSGLVEAPLEAMPLDSAPVEAVSPAHHG